MTPPSTLPDELSSAYIVDNYNLAFDAGDSSNASLYLCTPTGDAANHPLIGQLRAAGLWSTDDPKQVRDDQRAAYRDGLVFVAAAVYGDGDAHFILGRFDHPKFPSDAERWAAWLATADSAYERQR